MTTESFDEAYEKEIELQRELEKIEIAYAQVREKYSQFKECYSFIDYLRTIERVFMESKVRSWNADKSKDELIRAEIAMSASESQLGEELFSSIYEDFRKTSQDVGKVAGAVRILLDKNKGCVECCEFILYAENIFMNFQGIRKGGMKISDLKEKLIKARMNVLACDGHPEMKLLENIFKEFRSLIL